MISAVPCFVGDIANGGRVFVGLLSKFHNANLAQGCSVMSQDIETAVWSLFEGTLSLGAFEAWIYQSDSLKLEVGLNAYLALLENRYDDVEEVVEILQPWATAKYGSNVNLARSFRVLRLCRSVLDGQGEVLQQVRKLVHEARSDDRYSDTIDLWRDDAWGVLAQVDDRADNFPVGVDPRLVSEDFRARMATFGEEVRPDVAKACRMLVERYRQH